MSSSRLLLVVVPSFLLSWGALSAPEARGGETPPAVPADGEAAVTTASGLVYSVLKPGGPGRKPAMGDTVRLAYTGWLLADGKVFDDARARGPAVEKAFAELIPGLQEALTLMTPGARWKITVPPSAAFGSEGRKGVAADSTLVFDLELVAVRHQPAFRALDAAKTTTTASGLKIEIETPGEGEPLGPKDIVELDFSFWSQDGKLIESSSGKTGATMKRTVSSIGLACLKEALGLLRRGGRARLEAPPALAFGEKPWGSLAANSVTVWEIEVLSALSPLPVPPFERSAAGKARRLPSGVELEMLVEGTGSAPGPHDRITVHYAGWLARDGTLFDSSFERAEPMTQPLGNMIGGWKDALPEMKVGGKARLTIPAARAYGAKGQPPKIGPNEDLIFVVELLKVGG